MNLTGHRIVVTGATGFIGSHVTKGLLEGGAEVYAIVRQNSLNRARLLAHENLHIIHGTIENISDCVNQIGHADGFLHFAWGGVNRNEIDSPEVQKKNIESSIRCIQAAIKMECNIFMDAGSRVEYGITKDGTMSEDMDCHPINEYGKAKLEFYQRARTICQENKLKYYHIRFFSVYGTGDHPWSIISTLTRDLPLGKTISLSACSHTWNFMHIDDAAQAVIKLYYYSKCKSDSICIVNVASHDTRKLKSFVEEIYNLCGHRGKLEYGSFQQASEGALSICPTVDTLERLTDYDYHDCVIFKDGILEMLNTNC